MTTVTIDLPDHQAEMFQAKAATVGLTLETWLRKLAEKEAGAVPKSGRYALDDLLGQCDRQVSLTEEDRLWIEAPATGREAL